MWDAHLEPWGGCEQVSRPGRFRHNGTAVALLALQIWEAEDIQYLFTRLHRAHSRESAIVSSSER
jgi:hypothetical protein